MRDAEARAVARGQAHLTDDVELDRLERDTALDPDSPVYTGPSVQASRMPAPVTFPDHPRDLPDGECHAPAGYCAGFLDGDWLTVLGSAYEYVPLFATAERAAAWAVHKGWPRVFRADRHVIRWVERSGGYFRVSEPPVPAGAR